MRSVCVGGGRLPSPGLGLLPLAPSVSLHKWGLGASLAGDGGGQGVGPSGPETRPSGLPSALPAPSGSPLNGPES